MKLEFPPELQEQAFHTPDSRWSWPRAQAIDVVDYLAERQFSIQCVQVWFVCEFSGEPLSHTHVIPLEDGKAEIFQWEPKTPWQMGSESWEEYCKRARRGADHFIEDCPAEQLVKKAARGHIQYHIEFVSQDEYEGL